jgi:hypothetical protein
LAGEECAVPNHPERHRSHTRRDQRPNATRESPKINIKRGFFDVVGAEQNGEKIKTGERSVPSVC